MIRPGGPSPPEIVDLISELGIFGAIIGYVSRNIHLLFLSQIHFFTSNSLPAIKIKSFTISNVVICCEQNCHQQMKVALLPD